ncbi:unnamed protein product, partial [Brenthis ino]
MAATRRGYIFGAFVSSVLCVILIIVAISSDSWVECATYNQNDIDSKTSDTRYGLFGGQFSLYLLNTPSYSTLHMTCIPEINVCAVSCKTEALAREQEVRALAEGYRPNIGCVSVTTVNTNDPLSEPPVISFGVYLALVIIIFIQLLAAVATAILAIINAMTNPTEPIFGLPGCLWSNVVTAVLGIVVMLLFGVYWETSGLKEHLAFSFIALGDDKQSSSLGFSYWLLIVSILCSVANVALIELRRYLLERDPPPPTIKVENHSDGTIFLY